MQAIEHLKRENDDLRAALPATMIVVPSVSYSLAAGLSTFPRRRPDADDVKTR